MLIYEQFGRLAEECEALRRAYTDEVQSHTRTIDILRRLKAGELSLDCLEVEATEAKWKVNPEPPRLRAVSGSGAAAEEVE